MNKHNQKFASYNQSIASADDFFELLKKIIDGIKNTNDGKLTFKIHSKYQDEELSKLLNWEIITETSPAFVQVEKYLTKKHKVSLTQKWLKKNGFLNVNKHKDTKYPHNPCSIISILYRKDVFECEKSPDKKYFILKIKEDIDIDTILTKTFVKPTNIKSEKEVSEFFMKVAKTIQNMSFNLDDKQLSGLIFDILEDKRDNINFFDHIFAFRNEIITETSEAITKLNDDLEEKYKMSIDSQSCRKNGFFKMKNKNGIQFPYDSNSILRELYQKDVLNITIEEDKQYCILSIEKNVDIEKLFEEDEEDIED